MKANARRALQKAKNRQPCSIVLTEEERRFVVHLLRFDLTKCASPAAIVILESMIVKLEAAKAA